jgi:hypothetical protein
MFDKIRDLLRAQPFVPFEIRLSNWETYKVPHPECAALTPFIVVITDVESGKISECALQHVASVERLPSVQAPQG